MKNEGDLRHQDRLKELLLASRGQEFGEAERAELNGMLRGSLQARREAARWWAEESALVEGLQVGAVHSILGEKSPWEGVRGLATGPNPGEAKGGWRGGGWGWGWSAVAAGVLVVLGLGFGSAGWALSVALNAPKVAPLLDADFKGLTGRVAPGFPSLYGRWAGDPAEFVEWPGNASTGGRQALRFLEAKGDASAAGGRADSCDVFKVVDLRPIKKEVAGSGDASLELSAWFLDQREGRRPNLAMRCHLYLFEGNPEGLEQVWPKNLSQALATSHETWESNGDRRSAGWRRVATRCVVSARADFAVVHLGAGKGRKSLGEPELGQIYASDLQLMLRLSPARGGQPTLIETR